MNKKLTIEFAPGCFDDFEGTQEELSELLAELHQMVEDGTFMQNLEELSDEEAAAFIAKQGNTLQ
tara:strand:+ start:120 stop:314 length:195 start_codon:yes stop_codon:yes gene_type:complete